MLSSVSGKTDVAKESIATFVRSATTRSYSVFQTRFRSKALTGGDFREYRIARAPRRVDDAEMAISLQRFVDLLVAPVAIPWTTGKSAVARLNVVSSQSPPQTFH